MIAPFCHKGLKELYQSGGHNAARPEHAKRRRLILARLDAGASPEDMNLPGLGPHPVEGEHSGFWAVSVSGNLRVIFGFHDGKAMDVDDLDCH